VDPADRQAAGTYGYTAGTSAAHSPKRTPRIRVTAPDVTDPASARTAVEAAVGRFGRIDVLVTHFPGSPVGARFAVRASICAGTRCSGRMCEAGSPGRFGVWVQVTGYAARRLLDRLYCLVEQGVH
jgi:hypothetical protein